MNMNYIHVFINKSFTLHNKLTLNIKNTCDSAYRQVFVSSENY